MEKKITLITFFYLWEQFLDELHELQLSSNPNNTVEYKEIIHSFVWMQRDHVDCSFISALTSWFFYFSWMEFALSFGDRFRPNAYAIPLLARGCLLIWRNFFAYFGNRGIVGWRRLALLGFFTKLRFVTRYNYRRRAHYFFPRTAALAFVPHAAPAVFFSSAA